MLTTTSLSRKILIVIVALIVIGLLLQPLAFQITSVTMLSPTQLYPGLELWRLISYPIGLGGTFLGLFVGSIAFSVPGEELEAMLGTKRFGVLLLLLTALAGVMHFVVFFNEAIGLSGFGNLSLFVMVGYVYLFPRSEVRIFFFNVKSWVILALCAGAIIASALYEAFQGASPFLFFSFGGFGLVVGAAYFHARYQKYAFLLRPLRRLERVAERVTTPSAPARTPAPARRGAGPVALKNRVSAQRAVQREMSDEERLNSILDRISEQGYGSLTEEERRFLRDYSSKM